MLESKDRNVCLLLKTHSGYFEGLEDSIQERGREAKASLSLGITLRTYNSGESRNSLVSIDFQKFILLWFSRTVFELEYQH